MAAHEVTLLTRPGCHLCDDARELLQRVCGEMGVPVTERDITLDPDDATRYADLVPVTLVDNAMHDYWRVREDRLRAALS